MKEFSACAKQNRVWGVSFLFILMPSWLQAEEAQLVSDPMSSIGRVLFTLAGMIALILLLAYWAKRLQGANSSAGSFASSGKMIQTLATVSLGLKEKISLIQVGEQQLLIGITPQSIQTLLVLDKPIEQADIEQQTPVFQAILKKALNKT
ncbi:MAG: flagellar biosynthetic protein FliO [Oleispira sp.]|nr:flagellar biosynthetic protein FliO [Oleispira sp.]